MKIRFGVSAAVLALVAMVGQVHVVAAGPPPVVSASDDFERPDGPLGADWTVQNGTFEILGGAASGSGSGLATHNTAMGSAPVEVDVAYGEGSGVRYTGVVLEYLDLSNNIFVKIQDNTAASGAAFDTIFCYSGNNGGAFGSPASHAITPMTSAHMTVTIDGSRDVQIVLSEIDGGAGTESYTCPGAPVTGGSGVGIVGFNGGATVDNFRFGDPDTTPPTVVCDEPTPTFEVGGEGGEVTATVTDEESGPAEPTVSEPADVDTVGDYTVELTGADNAGNETTVECPYSVTAAPTSSTTTTTTTTTAPPGDSTQEPEAPAAAPTVASPTFTG